MKHIGIWIDKREAKIVSIEKGEETLSIVQSEIEEFKPKGGSGTKMKGGPQDVVQDSKYLNREKQQYAAYFKLLIEQLDNVEQLVILGPAEAGAKLYAEIEENHPHIFNKTKPVEKADLMTDNQLVAWVRNYFHIG